MAPTRVKGRNGAAAGVAEVVIRLRHTEMISSTNNPRGLFQLGGRPMTVQSNQGRHPDLFQDMTGQLTLLGAAVMVLLFFAWTYVH